MHSKSLVGKNEIHSLYMGFGKMIEYYHYSDFRKFWVGRARRTTNPLGLAYDVNECSR